MKLNEMFPRKYATGEDLNGKVVVVTIARITSEKMRPNQASLEVEKFVIYFQETKKGVVLSRTLARQIARAVGSDDTDNWTGKRVTLYPESMIVAGVNRVAIRAKATSNGAGTLSQVG
jgi:hypothetical protein